MNAVTADPCPNLRLTKARWKHLHELILLYKELRKFVRARLAEYFFYEMKHARGERIAGWHDLRSMAMFRAERCTDPTQKHVLMDGAYGPIIHEAWNWKEYRDFFLSLQKDRRELIWGCFFREGTNPDGTKRKHYWIPQLTHPDTVVMDPITTKLFQDEDNGFSDEEVQRLIGSVRVIVETQSRRIPIAFDRVPIVESEIRPNGLHSTPSVPPIKPQPWSQLFLSLFSWGSPRTMST